MRRNAEQYGSRPAMREKDRGIWQTFTWREYYDQVRDLALGLAALGFKRGDRLSRSEEHTSELQSQSNLVCRLLLEKKKKDRHNLLGDKIHVNFSRYTE